MSNLCKYILVALLLVLSTLGVAAASTATYMRIHVYSDGSIVIELTHTEPVENTGGLKEAFAQSILDVGDNYYDLQGEVLAKTTSICTPNYGCMYISGSVNTTTTSSRELFELNAKLTLSIGDNRGNTLDINVSYLNYKLNTTSLQAVISGNVELSATGEASQILEYAKIVNKTVIEGLLEQANITWISIDTFIADVSEPGKVKYSFTILLDLIEMAKKLELDTAFMRSEVAITPSTTYNILFLYNTTNINAGFSLRVMGDINEHLRHVVKTYNETYTQIEAALREIYALTSMEFSVPNIQPVIAILEKFTDNFTILKSRGTITVRLSENTLTVNITTPRLIKKNASSPLDTLMGLYNLAVDIQSTLGVEDILNTTVYLVPESGVKITRNGTVVEQVTLRELSEINVETTSPTSTPPPSILQQIPPMYLAVTAGVVVVLAVIGILASRRK